MKILTFPIKRSIERGLSLMEVALALGIISIVLASSYVYFSSGKSQADVERTFAQIKEVESAVVAWKSARRNYAGISAASVYSTGLLPYDMDPSSTSGLMMAASSPVRLNSISIGSVANDGFGMTLYNLPNDICVALALKPLEGNHYRTLIGNSSGGANVSVSPASDVETIASTCGSRDVSTVTYQYF